MPYPRRVWSVTAALAACGILFWTLDEDMDTLAHRTASYTKSSYQSWSKPSKTIINLLDPSIHLKTPGASLADQEHSDFAQMSFTLPSHPLVAGEMFNLTIQCDPSIIGDNLCTKMYLVHLRGPIAMTVPPVLPMYHHDETTGTTLVECTVPQEGIYEIWIWPDWPQLNACPDEPEEGPFGAVRGSGKEVITVGPGARKEIDSFRECRLEDYKMGITGRWVSVGHLREEYRSLLRGHLEKSAELHSHTTMPDYIYLPHGCKRDPLDYTHALEGTSDIRHVAYLGDSILRSTYCGSLYYSLHNGTVGEDCEFSDGWGEYQLSDKSFTIDTQSGRTVRFTQRFIDDHPENTFDRISNLNTYDEPVTHIITNLGMWFAAHSQEDYIAAISTHLDNLYRIFGGGPRYTWIDTYAVSPPIMCHGNMRRAMMKYQGVHAAIAWQDWLERHPDVRLNVVHSFPIVDARPETTSDGRHWVSEGGRPSLKVRPLVGSADTAVMEAVWDYWRLAAIE